jgi:hypothetical protein
MVSYWTGIQPKTILPIHTPSILQGALKGACSFWSQVMAINLHPAILVVESQSLE